MIYSTKLLIGLISELTVKHSYELTPLRKCLAEFSRSLTAEALEALFRKRSLHFCNLSWIVTSVLILNR